MEQQALTPAQEAEVEALAAEFMRHVQRVAVDVETASERLREVVLRTRDATTDDEFEQTFAVNVSAAVAALRALPDGAGTDAFVGAYSACQHG